MVASPMGAGRVVVVATAGSLASVDPATGQPWTVMPAWPSFLPIVRETLRYASGATIEKDPPLVGQPISGLTRGAAEVTITRPDNSQEATAVDSQRRAWQYDRTDRIGFYTAATDQNGGNCRRSHAASRGERGPGGEQSRPSAPWLGYHAS